jgi:hypothetical protein
MKSDRPTTPTTKPDRKNPKTLKLELSSKHRNGLEEKLETAGGV